MTFKLLPLVLLLTNRGNGDCVMALGMGGGNKSNLGKINFGCCLQLNMLGMYKKWV